jgi:hypothetical protein
VEENGMEYCQAGLFSLPALYCQLEYVRAGVHLSPVDHREGGDKTDEGHGYLFQIVNFLQEATSNIFYIFHSFHYYFFYNLETLRRNTTVYANLIVYKLKEYVCKFFDNTKIIIQPSQKKSLRRSSALLALLSISSNLKRKK